MLEILVNKLGIGLPNLKVLSRQKQPQSIDRSLNNGESSRFIEHFMASLLESLSYCTITQIAY